jgi:hypothetical protein
VERACWSAAAVALAVAEWDERGGTKSWAELGELSLDEQRVSDKVVETERIVFRWKDSTYSLTEP